MAVIVFYDTTELDRQQLTTALKPTDHYWEFVDGALTLDTLNPDAEIISVFLTSQVTAAVLDRLPRLRLICCRSIEATNIDLAATAERNITVVNVPNYGGQSVAEYTFTLLLALQRRLPKVLEVAHRSYQQSDLLGHELSGKTFGVIGAGQIGQSVLAIARGFGMRAIAYDTSEQPEKAEALGFSYVPFTSVLEESDIVSVHVPYRPATHHLLDQFAFQQMKSGAIFLNTARGGVVDTTALVEALQTGKLAGAALDAVEGDRLLVAAEEIALLRGTGSVEELRQHSLQLAALQRMENVILSPQNAFNTEEALTRINQTTAQNIIDFYNGQTPHQVAPYEPTLGKLILVRHTESEWNATGVWSGITDICLSEKGESDCIGVGEMLRELGIRIDVACYTEQRRTKQTLDGLLPHAQARPITQLCIPGFNERNYGQYTGMDKWKVKDEIGEEAFNQIRRGWDVAFPNGETLKDVYERVVPAYTETILPRLRAGENVLVVAHGNSLRALMKYLDDLSDTEIADLEMLMSEIVVYEIDPNTGRQASKQVVESGITIKSKF